MIFINSNNFNNQNKPLTNFNESTLKIFNKIDILERKQRVLSIKIILNDEEKMQ